MDPDLKESVTDVFLNDLHAALNGISYPSTSIPPILRDLEGEFSKYVNVAKSDRST